MDGDAVGGRLRNQMPMNFLLYLLITGLLSLAPSILLQNLPLFSKVIKKTIDLSVGDGYNLLLPHPHSQPIEPEKHTNITSAPVHFSCVPVPSPSLEAKFGRKLCSYTLCCHYVTRTQLFTLILQICLCFLAVKMSSKYKIT